MAFEELPIKPSTSRYYHTALKHFQTFLAKQRDGTIEDFLDQVEQDRLLPRSQRKHVDRVVLNGFAAWLQKSGYSPRTVGVYVGVVQSLAKYHDIPISLRYVRLPPAQPVNKKHPWTVEEVARFVGLMDNVQYQSIASALFQSGLSISDLLSLTYGDIRKEYEKGVTPLCLDLTRIKTNVAFITFLGSWALGFLRLHLQGRRLTESTPIYNVTKRAVDKYFARIGKKMGKFEGRNPYSPHSLRAAFNTILRDHKVDHLYIEYWMGHRLPEQLRAYINKSREGWRETYRTLAEPWLTPP